MPSPSEINRLSRSSFSICTPSWCDKAAFSRFQRNRVGSLTAICTYLLSICVVMRTLYHATGVLSSRLLFDNLRNIVYNEMVQFTIFKEESMVVGTDRVWIVVPEERDTAPVVRTLFDWEEYWAVVDLGHRIEEEREEEQSALERARGQG